MNDTLLLLMTMMAGLILGLLFFGGLWWTLRKGLESKNPALWFIASFFLRSAIVILGFYYLFGNNWKRLVASFLGFLIGRALVSKFIKQPQSEALHAS